MCSAFSPELTSNCNSRKTSYVRRTMFAISEEQNARCCAWPCRELSNGHWTKSRSNDQRYASEAGDLHRGLQSHMWSSTCVRAGRQQRRIVASDRPDLLLRHSELWHQVQHVARKELHGTPDGPVEEPISANGPLRPGHGLRLGVERDPGFQESQGVAHQFEILSEHGRQQLH